jgi:acyl dehydratase
MARDAQVGAEIPPLVIAEVLLDPMKTVAALLNDSNPIHWDVESVEALGMGDRVVNQGPNNMAYIVTMLADWAGDPGRVRGLRVRFLGNVFAGDRLTARGVVTGVREEGGERLADLDVRLERAEDDRVLDGTAVVALG